MPSVRLRCFHSECWCRSAFAARCVEAPSAGSGKREAGDDDREHDQHHGDEDVGQDHRLRIGVALRLRQLRTRLRGAAAAAAKDQVAGEQRRQHGAQRIERLHQVQPRRSRFRRADHGDIGVRRDLQQRDAAGDDEQHDQGDAVGRQARRDRHAERARRHDEQADDDRLLIAHPLDQLRRGDRREEIGDEPDRFDQRGLRVVQFEHRSQVRQQHAVDDSDEPPHEEEAGQQRQRGAVAPAGSAGWRGDR